MAPRSPSSEGSTTPRRPPRNCALPRLTMWWRRSAWPWRSRGPEGCARATGRSPGGRPGGGWAGVAALRPPGLGGGDDDLFTWRARHGGRWDHQRTRPDSAPDDHPVGLGLAWLGELHRERLWLSPSQVLERIVRDRRLMEVAVAERRPRDLWRRLRFGPGQCRAWGEAGGVTLRPYL